MATSNPATDLSDFISKIAPTLVNQRQSESSNVTISPDAINLSNLAFLQAMNMATSTQDALVANILKRASLSFAPTLAEEHTSGVYNSTTQAQLQNEALARATGEATDAVLKAQAAGTATAGGIANTRVNSQRNVDTKQQKQPSLGSKAGTIATSVIAAQLAKKGITKVGDLFSKTNWFGGPNDAAAIESAGGGSAAVDAAGVAATESATASADLAAGAVGAGEVGDILGASAAGAAGVEGADAIAEASGIGAEVGEGVSAAELGGSLGADAAVDAAGSAATDTAIVAAETAPEDTAAALGLEGGIGVEGLGPIGIVTGLVAGATSELSRSGIIGGSVGEAFGSHANQEGSWSSSFFD